MPRKKANTIDFRDPAITLIVGKNRTGKSSFARNLLEKIGSRALVVSYVGAPKPWRDLPVLDVTNKEEIQSFQGLRHVIWAKRGYEPRDNDTFKHIFLNYRKGALLLDDCRDYVNDPNIRSEHNKWLAKLLTHFTAHELDLYFIAHSPLEIPPRVWSFNYTLWIGATDAKFNTGQIKNFSAERIIEAQIEVNERFSKALEKADGSHYRIFKWIVP